MYCWYVHSHTHTHIYVHSYMYVYMYIYVRVCHTYTYMNTCCIYISCKHITTARNVISCTCMSMSKFMCIYVNSCVYM